MHRVCRTGLAIVRGVVTVAVCEDDPSLRSVLTRSFKAAGHEVVIARTGEEALRSFPPAAPDVVVIDIRLPATTAATSACPCAPAACPHPCSS